ncbi:MAG: hypothetical protein ROZ37_07495 [Aromatoleum sp.]|uniref:hypothetical protein n=1 Tax=Aromatoleum sp. TaxID=2307007 RepID=UPI00289486D8|nr:hypothetical protein [Aromatoleum sp.]MDT3670162.1 hypothetical protein [Aromatoleum sp.]
MTNEHDFDAWCDELERIAGERGLSWLVSPRKEGHLAAFQQGLSPDDELNALFDIGQWRGCGCGGG